MILSDDRFRKCMNHPAALRQRMLERGMHSAETDQASDDFEMISALHRMSETDRWAALQLLPDEDVARVVALIPHWREVQEMSDDEIERLYGRDE
jgi:hypothetical protein